MSELVTFKTPVEKLNQLEAVAKECNLVSMQDAGQFHQAFKLAAGMQKLDAMITPEMMEEILPLMNSPLGFRTDKDPQVTNYKTGKANEPYSMEVVKRCFIEATLHGFRVINNEFNIIGGNCYGTKNGYARKLKEYPGFADLDLSPSVPKLVGEKGAIVTFKASWTLDGVPMSIEREFAVKVNASMGADAILGKATRKILAAIYGKLTGSEHSLPEGEVGDEVIDVQSRPSKEASSPAVDDLKARAEVDGMVKSYYTRIDAAKDHDAIKNIEADAAEFLDDTQFELVAGYAQKAIDKLPKSKQRSAFESTPHA